MGKFVVKFRKFILVLAFSLLVPAFIGFLNTRVNYDMLNYLPSETDTVKGQNELLKDFERAPFL